jgi:hypothetical protein
MNRSEWIVGAEHRCGLERRREFATPHFTNCSPQAQYARL